jgi:hypothetical protein
MQSIVMASRLLPLLTPARVTCQFFTPSPSMGRMAGEAKYDAFSVDDFAIRDVAEAEGPIVVKVGLGEGLRRRVSAGVA